MDAFEKDVVPIVVYVSYHYVPFTFSVAKEKCLYNLYITFLQLLSCTYEKHEHMRPYKEWRLRATWTHQ